MEKIFSPSLMCMDLAKFKDQIDFLSDKVESYHVDIMDGHFVPNLTLSPWFVEQVKNITNAPISVHLMVTNPSFWIDELVSLKTDYICCHAEAINGSAYRIIEKVHNNNLKFGIVLNPETPISNVESYLPFVDRVTLMSVDPGFAGQTFIQDTLNKIDELKRIREENLNTNFKIEIDGQCNKKTFHSLKEAGAEVLIVGNSGLFDLDEDIASAWDQLQMNFKKA